MRTSEAPDAPCVMEISCEKPFCGIFGGKRYHEMNKLLTRQFVLHVKSVSAEKER